MNIFSKLVVCLSYVLMFSYLHSSKVIAMEPGGNELNPPAGDRSLTSIVQSDEPRISVSPTTTISQPLPYRKNVNFLVEDCTFKSADGKVELPFDVFGVILSNLTNTEVARIGEVSKVFYTVTRNDAIWEAAWEQVGLLDLPPPCFHKVTMWDVAERGFLKGRASRNVVHNEQVIKLLPAARRGDIVAQRKIGQLIITGAVRFPICPPLNCIPLSSLKHIPHHNKGVDHLQKLITGNYDVDAMQQEAMKLLSPEDKEAYELEKYDAHSLNVDELPRFKDTLESLQSSKVLSALNLVLLCDYVRHNQTRKNIKESDFMHQLAVCGFKPAILSCVSIFSRERRTIDNFQKVYPFARLYPDFICEYVRKLNINISTKKPLPPGGIAPSDQIDYNMDIDNLLTLIYLRIDEEALPIEGTDRADRRGETAELMRISWRDIWRYHAADLSYRYQIFPQLALDYAYQLWSRGDKGVGGQLVRSIIADELRWPIFPIRFEGTVYHTHDTLLPVLENWMSDNFITTPSEPIFFSPYPLDMIFDQ